MRKRVQLLIFSGFSSDPHPQLALGEKAGEQPFRCAEAFSGQDDGFGLADRVGD